MEKMTKRNFYEALVNFANGGEFYYSADGTEVIVDNEAIIAFAENEIALLDKKATKAKERAASKKADSDELTEAVRVALSTEEFEPIAEIATRIEGEDVTVAKIQWRLNSLVKDGVAEKQQITVAGGEGQKSRKLMAYKLV